MPVIKIIVVAELKYIRNSERSSFSEIDPTQLVLNHDALVCNYDNQIKIVLGRFSIFYYKF
jgi:hypothetical protein